MFIYRFQIIPQNMTMKIPAWLMNYCICIVFFLVMSRCYNGTTIQLNWNLFMIFISQSYCLQHFQTLYRQFILYALYRQFIYNIYNIFKPWLLFIIYASISCIRYTGNKTLGNTKIASVGSTYFTRKRSLRQNIVK